MRERICDDSAAEGVPRRFQGHCHAWLPIAVCSQSLWNAASSTLVYCARSIHRASLRTAWTQMLHQQIG